MRLQNESENMENPKHCVFCENIVFFQVPAISRVLGASGNVCVFWKTYLPAVCCMRPTWQNGRNIKEVIINNC